MSIPVSWSLDRVRQVFTTESRQKERELFLQVHQPFRQIRVDFCKDRATPSFITEADLRDFVTSGPLDAHNRLYFVVGEAGSGKSELCQWLEYTIAPTERLIVHIPRSMTTAAHVASLLQSRIGSHFQAALHHTPIETKARFVALSAVILLYERGEHSLSPASLWEKVLSSDTLHAHLQTFLSGPRDFSNQVLSDSQVAELVASQGASLEPRHLLDAAAQLRTLVRRALDQTLWLGDVRDLLSQISDQSVAAGRRPLLLIEDITAFQLLGDLLLDYLLDLTSGHFDAVIGVTTGFERTQLARATLSGDLTHIHHRLRGRFVLTDPSGRSYGFEDDVVDFARSYLQAAKHPDTDPPEFGTVFGPGLYPFTITALHRALAALHEEGNPRQTPRLFLEHVLGAVLLSSDIPSLTLDRSPFLQPPTTHFRTDEVPDERLRSILRWYGNLVEDCVTLDPHIPELWGITVPASLVRDGMLRASRTYVAPRDLAAPIQDSWQNELRELQAWLTHGGSYPSRETLKRGIERVVLELGDPRSLANPHSLSATRSEIYYARGDERLPIFLEDDSGDTPSVAANLKVQVGRSAEERTILEELAYLSLSGESIAQVCSNPVATLAWARNLWDTYNGQARAILTDRLGGLDPDALVFISWRLISALVGDFSTPPSTGPIDLSGSNYASIAPWSPTEHRAVYTAGEALLPQVETLRRLFVGVFGLRDTFIDSDRYYRQIDAAQPAALLAQLARFQPATLRTVPFKVRPGNLYLHELLAPLQRYAHALLNLDVPTALAANLADIARRREHLQVQLTLDTTLLQQQLDSIRIKCGEVGVIWREAWDPAFETLSSITSGNLSSLMHDIASVEGTGSPLTDPDAWEYQRFLHQARPVLSHPYWSALTALSAIQAELTMVARTRFSRDGRFLAGTRSYRELLEMVRQARREVRSAC